MARATWRILLATAVSVLPYSTATLPCEGTFTLEQANSAGCVKIIGDIFDNSSAAESVTLLLLQRVTGSLKAHM